MAQAPATEPRFFRQLINGEWIGADEVRTFDDLNPFSGEVFARIPASGAAEAQRAIDAAHQAFPAWAALGARARQALFLKAADILERRADEVVLLMAQETGSAAPFSRFQVQWTVGVLRQAASYPNLPGEELDAIRRSAKQAGVPLDVIQPREPALPGLYSTRFTLIHPDQCIAWRGNVSPPDGLSLVRRIAAHGA